MMKYLIILVTLLTMVSGVTAQSNQCEQELQAMLALTNERCADLPANTACFGAGYVEMIYDDGTLIESVAEAGDNTFSENVAQISTFSLPDGEEPFGVAFVTLDIPDTDQSIKLFFIGDIDVVFDLEVIDGQSTLYLDLITFPTGDKCSDSNSGVLLQTPTGIPVAVDINRAQMTLGSTVYFTVNEDRRLQVTPIEGTAQLSDNTSQPLVPGFSTEIELDPETNEVTGEWSDFDVLDDDFLDDLEVFEAIDDDFLSYEFDVFDDEYLDDLTLMFEDDDFDYDTFIDEYDEYDEFIEDEEDFVDDEEFIDDDEDFVDDSEEDDYVDDGYDDELEDDFTE